MKRTIFVFLFILFLVSIVNAQEDKIENFVRFSSVNMDVRASSDIEVQYVGSNPELAEMRISLTFVPFDTEQQQVGTFDSTANPLADINEKEGEVIYLWGDPVGQKLSFGFNYQVRVNNVFPKIRNKVSFPILNLDSDRVKYVKPTEKVLITEAISRQAAEIIEGEDDLYKVVYKLADWTKTNINYDLNTLTAKAVQNSEWVLQNREGVCDEMTTLFIAFLRSQGIPARFVSGMVYTNLGYNWGAHGWAEVYFPSVGWVPYDPTFGQYGFVDPSHIKMKHSFDPAEPSLNYNWRSRDIEIKTNELDLVVDLVSKGGVVDPLIDLDASLLKSKVGFGSYVPLQVHVTNKNNYYVSTSLYVTKSPGLVGDNIKSIYLEPNEERDIYWIIEVPEGDRKFVYTSTIEAKSQFGAVDSDLLEYSARGEVYTLELAEERIGNLEIEETPKSRLLSFECITDREEYYEYDSAVFDCTLINNGDEALNNLQVCLRDDCQVINLNINEKARLVYGVGDMYEDVYLVASNDDIIKYTYPGYVFLRIPNIRITEVDYPDTLRYDESGELSFVLDSDSEANNVQVIINKISKLDLNKFSGKQIVTVPIKGHKFGAGNKKIEIGIIYYDANGNKYEAKEEFDIYIENIGFFEKIKFWLNLLF